MLADEFFFFNHRTLQKNMAGETVCTEKNVRTSLRKGKPVPSLCR